MASQSLGTLTLDLIAKTGGFESGMDQAARYADKRTRDIERQATERAKSIEIAFTNMAKSMAAPLIGATIGIQGIRSLDALKDKISSTIESMAELKESAEKTGASVENLSALKSVAKIGGHDYSEIEAAMTRLNKALHGTDDESKGAGKALAALGLDLDSLRSKDPADAMLALAQAQEKFADGGGKSAALMAILSKNGAALIPYLHDLAEQGSIVGKVTSEQAKAADEYEKNVKRLEASWGMLSKQMAAAVVGPAKDITDWMVKAQKEGGALYSILVGIGAGLTKALGGEINPLKNAESSIDSLFSKLGKLKGELETEQQSNANGKHGGLLGFIENGLSNRKIADIEKQIEGTQKALSKAIALRNKLLGQDVEENQPKDTSLNGKTFGAEPKEKKEKISDGQRLVEQLQSRLATTQQLTEVEKLESDLANKRYANATPAEQAVAMSLAQQIDFRNQLNKQLDDELAATHELTRQYEQQEARLKQLVETTQVGQNLKRMQDEALLESALSSGKINQTTYDQAIEKLHEVKETGKNTFDELKSVIEGWGKESASAIVDFCFTGKTSFADMVSSMLKELAKMMIYKNITQPMADGLSGWIGGLFGSSSGAAAGASSSAGAAEAAEVAASFAAKGAWFDGSVSAFARGGTFTNSIVSSPTSFKFASGGSFKNGVMGEAGPEAILPLKRGSDGSLGVSLNGGSASGGATSQQINININVSNDREAGESSDSTNSTSDEVSAWKQIADRVRGTVVDELVKQKRPGGLLTA